MPSPDEDDPGGLISPEDIERLRSRITRIQKEGLATPAQKLFDFATSQPPQQMMVEFFRSSPEAVTQSMQEAVTSLLGALPPFEFDAQACRYETPNHLRDHHP